MFSAGATHSHAGVATSAANSLIALITACC
ncbi:Uncharacterised protein [Vibrio cholerae]|nr:Uncharacterised protein [Vibrio cholerae]